MEISQLIELGLSEPLANKVMELYLKECVDTSKAKIRADYVLYYKELNMKKKVEELRLERYAFEYDNVNGITDPKRKEAVEVRMRMQHAFVEKFKDFYYRFDKMLTNYANTFNDTEARIFNYLYLKGLKVKEVAEKVGLSSQRIRHIKMKFDKDLKELFVAPEILT